MQGEWIVTFAPIVGLLASVLAQIAVAHAFRRVAPSIIIGLGLGFAVTGAVTAVGLASPVHTTADAAAAFVMTLATFLALGFGYLNFLNLNITSLRIRMLREILHAEPSGISRQHLMTLYTEDELLRRRLIRLERSGQMSLVDGRWRLTSGTLLLLARTLALLRFLVLPPAAHQREE